MSQKLYEHVRHPHHPRNINQQLQEEQAAGGFNTRLAVLLVRAVGSMPAAYSFAALALVGLLAILGIVPPLIALLVAWASQVFIQLTLLPVIMVGQNVLGRKEELLADETFANTQKTFADTEQLIQHLHAQDTLALQQQQRLQHVQELLLLLLEHMGVEAEPTTGHEFPIVRFNHETRIDKDQLLITLARAGFKPELLGSLSLETLMVLEKERPHSQERGESNGNV